MTHAEVTRIRLDKDLWKRRATTTIYEAPQLAHRISIALECLMPLNSLEIPSTQSNKVLQYNAFPNYVKLKFKHGWLHQYILIEQNTHTPNPA